MKNKKNSKPLPWERPFLLHPSEMASLSNSRWQNRKQRPNMVDKAKRDVMSEWVCDIYLIIKKMSF